MHDGDYQGTGKGNVNIFGSGNNQRLTLGNLSVQAGNDEAAHNGNHSEDKNDDENCGEDGCHLEGLSLVGN